MKRFLFVFTMLFCTILANTQNQFEVYGNNREVWCGNNNTTVQRTQYYPSGLPWAEGTGAAVQNRKYNGKEFIEMHGYDTYDYGARGYYPAIMRFTTVDPKAENFSFQSPYSYGANNPILNIDVNGEYFLRYSSKYGGNYVAHVTNHNWINKVSRLSAIPYAGLVFEASLWGARAMSLS